MFYYERLGKKPKQLKRKKYFKNRIANNLFYGLEKEFSILPYPIPKSNLGLRNYTFFTYPMRVIYYSVGLYLLQLSQEFIQQYHKTHKHIISDYGGWLYFDDKTHNLILKYDSIWYKRHYKRFRNRVRREVKDNLDEKIVIHLDIQNYYDEVSLPILLKLLTEYIKPSIQRELRFDAITKGQIASFFNFMAKGDLGIPQSDNDIVSSFIGYLYLVFGDLFLDQELLKDCNTVENYAIIRYMDDIYISVTFYKHVGHAQREIYINSLASRIADCLYNRLGLRLNTKTKLFWLNNEKDIEELLDNLKKVSPSYEGEVADDENTDPPDEKVKRIFRQLENLKKSSLDPTFKQRRELDSEILKEVYTPSVNQLLNAPHNKARIKRVFSNFNFDLIIAQPREILIILLIDPDAKKQFRKFLLSKRYLTSRDIHLIITYLCQTNFKSSKLIRQLVCSNQMQDIMRIYGEGEISSQEPGYFNLSDIQVLRLSTMHNVIEQIKLRVLSERRLDYSVALNHLLNEIHAICLTLDQRNIPEKQYDATKTVQFLVSSNVPHETCLKIRNLFDRRNKNPVSHADPIAWPVGKDEYLDYHNHVGVCLKYVL
jgi:AbiA family abortive infection protein